MTDLTNINPTDLPTTRINKGELSDGNIIVTGDSEHPLSIVKGSPRNVRGTYCIDDAVGGCITTSADGELTVLMAQHFTRQDVAGYADKVSAYADEVVEIGVCDKARLYLRGGQLLAVVHYRKGYDRPDTLISITLVADLDDLAPISCAGCGSQLGDGATLTKCIGCRAQGVPTNDREHWLAGWRKWCSLWPREDVAEPQRAGWDAAAQCNDMWGSRPLSNEAESAYDDHHERHGHPADEPVEVTAAELKMWVVLAIGRSLARTQTNLYASNQAPVNNYSATLARLMHQAPERIENNGDEVVAYYAQPDGGRHHLRTTIEIDRDDCTVSIDRETNLSWVGQLEGDARRG